ncbi:cytidylyltransferase domain-containing protein [Rhizoctonia solani AG-1 IA]|uniref:Cytidylyltransferase domain-containing protein n=1 Tax=Thanatephorus cucumeris (strain AG1-IA) TaxID=983506 RepID=L8X3Z7_THACA|nr:cytidylyltransferase domain-containing protein [Rhizoctonia solani AG-1 IA]
MNSSYKISLLYFHFDEKSSVRLAETIRQVAHQTTRRLIVVLVSPEFDHSQHEHLASKWDWIQNILVLAYVPAAHTAQIRDDPLFNTDVILVLDANQAARHLSGETWDAIFTLEGVPAPKALVNDSHQIAAISAVSDHPDSRVSPLKLVVKECEPKAYPVSALGGTFDYLHPGHKILLSMAAWITTSKLIAGVTDDALLTKKANKRYIQSISERTASVRSFVRMFKPSIECDAVPIQDVYGPTGWDPNIQALVVSRETLGGASSGLVADFSSSVTMNLTQNRSQWLNCAPRNHCPLWIYLSLMLYRPAPSCFQSKTPPFFESPN